MSKVTVTGVVQDVTGVVATSGYVQFDLMPLAQGVEYYVSNTTVLAPSSAQCGIDGSGNVKNLALTGSCQVWGNDVISPQSTTYTVTFAPNSVVASVVPRQSITGSSYSLNSPVFSSPVSITPQYTITPTTSLNVNLVPATDNTYSLGDSTHKWQNVYATSASVGSLNNKGPNPWWDVCANGLACDGATDDTAAFNSLLTTACTGGGGTLWIPPAKTVRFASAPNHIPCGLTIAGAYSKGSAFGFGSFIKCDFTEATATNGCLWWDGANLATQGNGGGVRGVNIQKGDGKTGGAAIKVSGASCAARAGNVRIDGVKVSSSTGTWNYGMYVDGTACTTLGTAGSRDNEIVGLDIFSATTKAVSLNTCVHCYIFGLETAIGAGSNADVEVTGTSTANAASNDVLIAASEMTNLTFDWATNITCAGCNVTGTFTSTANNTSSTFHGVAGGYSTASASVYTQNTTIVPGGSYANIVAAGVVPNLCTAVGYMCESTGPTAGTHFIGSDGLFFFRRNTGSAAGSNFTWTYDSGSTFPFAFDATNGFTSTLPIISPSLRLNGNTLNGITGTGTAVVTNGGPTITGTTTLSTVSMSSENASALPHMTWTAYAQGNLTTGSLELNKLTPDKPIIITALEGNVITGSVTCSTLAQVDVFDLSSSTSLLTATIGNALNEFGTTGQAINVTAGHSIALRVKTAASGCFTAPANANLTMQYKMQ